MAPWKLLCDHGLQRYGFDREARLLAEKSYEVSAPDKSVREWYNAETGKARRSRTLRRRRASDALYFYRIGNRLSTYVD